MSSEDNSNIRKMDGLPVVREDGARLGFMNPEPSSNTIHISRIEEPPQQKSFAANHGTRCSWSVCGGGAARGKTEPNSIYLDEDEVTDKYIQREGEIVGKLCSNCRTAVDPNADPFGETNSYFGDIS